jgi:hypothetical protein
MRRDDIPTSFQIDKEIRRIVDESYDTAEDVLVRNRVLLDKLSKKLIEVETVDGEHLERLIEEYAVRSGAPQTADTTKLGQGTLMETTEREPNTLLHPVHGRDTGPRT